MFFIFTNNFIDLDILSVLAISHYWLLVGRDPGSSKHLPMHKTAPQKRIIWPKCQQYQETSQTAFDKFDKSQCLLHTLQQIFFCVSVVFTFVEIIKHNKLKMLYISFNIKMAAQIFTNFDVFFKCMLIITAITIQSNNIVSIKVKTKHY